MTLISNGLANAVPFRFTYADATARAAATGFTSADLYSLALQLDNASAWILTATTPTWVAAGGTFTDPTTTKGDLLTRSSSAVGRLGVGSNGQALIADSTQTLGIKWGSVSPGYKGFSVHKNATAQTVASASTFTKVTWSTEEWDTESAFASDKHTPNIAGKYQYDIVITWNTINVDKRFYTTLYKNGSRFREVTMHSRASTAGFSVPLDLIVDANGSTDYFEVYGWTSEAGTPIEGDVLQTRWQGVYLGA